MAMIKARIATIQDRVNRLFYGPAQSSVYAICRMSFAFVSMVNLLDLFPHRYRLFAPEGMISQDVVVSLTQSKPYFSVFHYIGSSAHVDWVFAIAFMAMVGLFLGLLSRVCAIVCLAWYLSYTYYIFPAIHSWDHLLRIYAFVLVISPLGTRFSLDARWLPSWIPSFLPRDGVQAPRYGLLL